MASYNMMKGILHLLHYYAVFAGTSGSARGVRPRPTAVSSSRVRDDVRPSSAQPPSRFRQLPSQVGATTTHRRAFAPGAFAVSDLRSAPSLHVGITSLGWPGGASSCPNGTASVDQVACLAAVPNLLPAAAPNCTRAQSDQSDRRRQLRVDLLHARSHIELNAQIDMIA